MLICIHKYCVTKKLQDKEFLYHYTVGHHHYYSRIHYVQGKSNDVLKAAYLSFEYLYVDESLDKHKIRLLHEMILYFSACKS